ncbi:MAG: SMP-30/gluconolactonase/LRE family protein [Acidobacteria bacterium]|nr:SMP-30/gluconolactonase/LRE family protein [Acidobacteriota bacterium]
MVYIGLAMRSLLLAASALSLLAQDLSKLSIEKVSGGFTFTEGPVWHRDNFLLFSDVPENKIWKLTSEGKFLFRENTNGANGNTLDEKGRLYTCETRGRRVIRTDLKTNAVEILADKFEGKRLNAPNDIAVRKDGHVYFTDPAFGAQSEGRELDFFGVYHIPLKGPIELVAKTAGRPNGIALSPNGRLLYVADSDERAIRVFDLANTGKAANGRVLIKGIDGPPDGIRVDEKGQLWVTCNNVAIYSPDGKFVNKIDFPETPRNIAFGDGDFSTIYVTAQKSVYRVRLDVKGSMQY